MHNEYADQYDQDCLLLDRKWAAVALSPFMTSALKVTKINGVRYKTLIHIPAIIHKRMD